VEVRIRRWPDPVLLTRCSEWDFENPPLNVSRNLELDLLTIMTEENGIGLAANQIGIPYRVLAIHIQESGEKIVMFNPELSNVSEELWEHPEGCLSFPRVELTISRPRLVTVRYQDRNSVWCTKNLKDIDAKCIQHEIDHLDGKTFKDYVSPLKFGRAVERSRKR
jgi:peptide deformylase